MKYGVWVVDLEPFWLTRGVDGQGVSLAEAVNCLKKYKEKWPNDECIVYKIVNGSSTTPLNLNTCASAL